MDEFNFVECLKCGTIHYVVNKEEAGTFKESLTNGFSERDINCCFKCGSKDRFSIMSEYYVSHFAFGDKIPPILLDYGELEKATFGKSKS